MYMTRSLLSAGLVVVPKFRVDRVLSHIIDLSDTSNVVLESVPFHTCDVVEESVPVHILVHIHLRLANDVVHNLDLLSVKSRLSIVIVVFMSRFPDIVVS